MWIGVTAFAAYHCVFLALDALAEAVDAHTAVDTCKKLTGAVVFVLLWKLEDIYITQAISIAIQTLPIGQL